MTLLQSLNKPNCSIAGISEMLRRRHRQTQMHCERVVVMADYLAKACALAPDDHEILLYSALLHDIGKIGIPDTILMFPGDLDEQQREVMRQHSTTGETIVRLMQLANGDEIADYVRHHHEHYDGRGYPDGLAGAAIPRLARMLTILDCYDALREPRVYRKALKHNEAVEIMRSESGIKHDPELLERFLAIEELEAITNDYSMEMQI